MTPVRHPAPAATPSPTPPPVTAGAAPRPGATGSLHVLQVRLFDLHAARGFAARLEAAGVGPSSIQVTGRRCSDGLVESDVRPASELTDRWRLNAGVALVAAVVVGLPVGASLLTIILGERPWITATGAVLGCVLVGVGGLRGVWGDHLQRFPDTRPASRVEGVVTVTGDVAVVRAEMLLTTTQAVMGVTRRPA